MWHKDDPRETCSSGWIVVLGGQEAFYAFFDGDHDGCWYITTHHPWSKYQHIAPGAEIEEWPSHWVWAYVPKD